MPPTISIERIGYTNRAFRIQDGNSIYKVRTSSSRRYLLVNLYGPSATIEKRTDNFSTACNEQRKLNLRGGRAILIDTVQGVLV